MSVTFANAIIAGLKKYGVKVVLSPGWERRGNGQVSDYEGGLMHHTATGYSNATPGSNVHKLLVEGRPDLSGPLCNSAGNEDGSVTIISAGPANHAGASGGRSMGPLPVTSSFNKRVWGHEIVYPGNTPMKPAQYNTMIILGKVICEILKTNSQCIRAHAETSITGKWDPGYAPGKTINMTEVRTDITNFKLNGGEDELSWNEKLRDGTWTPGGDETAKHAVAYIWQIQKRNENLAEQVRNLDEKVAALSAKLDKLVKPDVDEVALAKALIASGLTSGLSQTEVQTAVVAALKSQFNK